MYDIKTQDREGVLAYKDSYERQLNVYAYIWQKLRGELLDKIAIIATQFPRPVEEAWKNGDADQLAQALADWEPLVDIDLNPAHLQQMIAAFAMTVDQIEDSRFSAPELRWLERRDVHDQTFATRVCRNCDGRFSCRSYREYAVTEGRRHPDKYQRYYEDFGEEDALEDWRTAALGAGAG
jgi:hypothetical protein